MAIAYDNVSNATPGTGNLSWTHSPSGTPKGVLVFIVQNSGSTDEVSGVTYGGTTMTEVSGSPNLHTSGETGAVYCYFLGSSVPTGNQTVAVTVTGSSTKMAVCFTVTATGNTQILDVDATVNSTSLANPSVTLSVNGRGAFAAIGFHSGQNAPSSNTALTNWTESYEYDFGTQTSGVYRYNTIGTSDVTAGWTQSAEDATMIAIALADTQQNLTVTGVASAGAYGTPTVTPGAVNLSPTGIATAQAFGTPTITIQIVPSGIATAQAFGSVIVSGSEPSEFKIKGNKGFLSASDTTGSYARAIAYATKKSDVEIYTDFTWENNLTQSVFRVFLRASRDWNTADKPTQAYELAINSDGGYVINRITSGTRTQIGSGSWTATTSASGLRFQVVGTDVRAKVWTGTEPTDWDTEIDDSVSGFTTEGILQLGLFRVSSGDHSLLLDNLLYTTPVIITLIEPTGIATAEAFGTPTISVGAVNVAPSGISSAQAFGTATITTGAVNVSPTGIASAQALGTPTVTPGAANVAPSGIATAEAFGTATITTLTYVYPSGIASAQAFGTALLTQDIPANGIPSAEAFGTPVVGRGAVNVSPSGIASSEAFGTATISVGATSVYPSGIASAQAFGTATITTGAVNVAPSGIASAQAFGTPSIIAGAVAILPSGIATQEAVGQPVLTAGSINIQVSGISTGEAFGTATLAVGTTFIYPTGIAGAEAFGSATIGQAVYPTGISSAQAFGTATVVPGSVNITVSGIASAEAFGQPFFGVAIYPSSIASAESFGTATILTGSVSVYPSGIVSSEAFGTASVVPGVVYIYPSGIASAAAFGTATVTPGVVSVYPTAISSIEAFGTASFLLYLLPGSVSSQEALGTVTITPGVVSVYPSSITTSETFGYLSLYSLLLPEADISIGAWTNQDGGTTNLYSVIDDDVLNDADYVKSDVTGTDSDLVVVLNNGIDPQVHTDHVVYYRYKQVGAGNAQLSVSLMDGATTIASWIHSSIGSDWVDAEHTISSDEASSIVNYDDLRLKFSVVDVA